jgi:hypothetical protein
MKLNFQQNHYYIPSYLNSVAVLCTQKIKLFLISCINAIIEVNILKIFKPLQPGIKLNYNDLVHNLVFAMFKQPFTLIIMIKPCWMVDKAP